MSGGRPGRPGPAVAWALAGVVALAACGVGTESEPRTLAADDVPFGLLQSPSSTVTTTPPPGLIREMATVSVFLLQEGRLVGRTRDVPAPPEIRTVLEQLLDGPTEEEARDGVLTAISPATELLDVRIEGTVARVNLSASFAESQVQDQTVAVAQIVFTAAGLPGVSGIMLELAGRSVEVPAADGTLRRGSLTPADYATLASG